MCFEICTEILNLRIDDPKNGYLYLQSLTNLTYNRPFYRLQVFGKCVILLHVNTKPMMHHVIKVKCIEFYKIVKNCHHCLLCCKYANAKF